MENKIISKYTVSFGLSLALCSVLNAVLVVVKEKSPVVQAEMKKLTGHHWVTHSVIVIGLFILLGWLLAQAKSGQGITLPASRLLNFIIAGIMTAGLIIVGFYLVAD